MRKIYHTFPVKAMRALFVVLVLLLLMPMQGMAAQSKAKKFSKKYRNERLEVVLKDLCRNNDYTLKVLDPDIDLNKRITAEFKNVSTGSVLKKVLDADCQGKVKRRVLTISRKPAPPQTYTVLASTPSEVVDNDTMTLRTYQDTVFTVTCRTETKEISKPEPAVKQDENENGPKTFRKGHNIQLLLGAGYSSMGYNMKDAGKETGAVGGSFQFRYLYYFTDNWGIGAGVGFSTYGSVGTLNTTTLFYDPENYLESTAGRIDTDDEHYGHRVRSNEWSEKQRSYMVDIPVMVQCTYPLKNAVISGGNVKLYADLGVNIGLNVLANRQLKSGSIDHVGYYREWGLMLDHVNGHDFYTEQVEEFDTDKEKLTFKLPAVGLMADLGFAFPVKPNIDLLLGVYMNYTVNNICDGKREIGWKQTKYADELEYRNHDFMNAYRGLIGTQYAQQVHPWQVGVRFGVNFNCKKKEKPVEPECERLTVCDTTFALQPRVEKTIKPKPQIVVEKIKRVLEKSVIWFDLNSVEPKLEPADILEKIAEIMKENPDQRIMITGHASKEGNKETNQRLSEGRAKAIMDALIALGVNPNQMRSQGVGIERDYITGEHNIALDRRAEITPLTEDASNE